MSLEKIKTGILKVKNVFFPPKEEDTVTEEEIAYIERLHKETGLLLYHSKQQKLEQASYGKLKEYLVFDQWDRTYYSLIGVTSLAVIYNVFFIILRCCFTEVEHQHKFVWLIFDILFDVIYIFDMFVESRKALLQNGLFITEKKVLLATYIRSRSFAAHLISIIPLDYALWPVFGVNRLWFRLTRLLRFGRLMEFLDRSWFISLFPRVTQLVTQGLYLFIIMHWNTCLYYQMSKFMGFDSDTWVFSEKKWPSMPGKYIICFYWTAMQLSTIGETKPAIRTPEFIFVVCNLLFGLVVFATIVGNVASLVSTVNAQKTEYQLWAEEVNKYMKRHNVSWSLQHRVNAWFQHYWNENRAMPTGDKSPVSILPEKLQAEINMNAHIRTLRKVKIFQDCEPGLLIQLVNRLKLVMFNPDEFLFHIGDVGKEMFIIKSGKLDVLGVNDKFLVTLGSGSAFGELSLLNIPGMIANNRRSAAIRSKGYSMLFSLSKEDLWQALDNYPEARETMIEKGRQLLIKDGMLDATTIETPEARAEWAHQCAGLTADTERLTERMGCTVVGMAWDIKRSNQRLDILEEKMKAEKKEKHSRKKRQ